MFFRQLTQQTSQLLHTLNVFLIGNINNCCNSKHIIHVTLIIVVIHIFISRALFDNTPDVGLTDNDIGKFREVDVGLEEELFE
jgi:hypothetical protein